MMRTRKSTLKFIVVPIVTTNISDIFNGVPTAVCELQHVLYLREEPRRTNLTDCLSNVMPPLPYDTVKKLW